MQQTAASASESQLDRHSTQTVLAVDDEDVNLTLIELYLEDYGLITKTATDGEMALEIAQKTPPDLVLLDICMPGIDGFEVCKRLKADPKCKNVPVIFFSAMVDEESKARGFEVGGIDYITKPVQRKELVARVTTHLNQHQLYRHLMQRLDAYEEHYGPLPEGELEASNTRLQRVYQAQDILKKNMRQPPSMEDLADQLGISHRRLSREFQLLYGMSVFSWFREHRLQDARRLLRSTDTPVEEIAEMVGYTSGANFATAFRQRFNITPRSYRKSTI